MTTELPEQACLACGHVMSLHAQMAKPGDPDATPTPGDVALCIRCGFVMAFDADLKFRHLTKEEMDEALQDERVARAIVAIAELDGKKRQQ